MTHSMRDPNRDHVHGRIWRMTYKNRSLVAPAKIDGASIAQLLDLLKAYEDRTRYRTRVELRNRDTEQVMAELKRWVAALDPRDENYWHNMLEALWLRQQHDVVDQDFLKLLLRCPEPKARAAATRVLCHWRDRVDASLDLLRVQVGDENARVRLEAVERPVSFRATTSPARWKWRPNRFSILMTITSNIRLTKPCKRSAGAPRPRSISADVSPGRPPHVPSGRKTGPKPQAPGPAPDPRQRQLRGPTVSGRFWAAVARCVLAGIICV